MDGREGGRLWELNSVLVVSWLDCMTYDSLGDMDGSVWTLLWKGLINATSSSYHALLHATSFSSYQGVVHLKKQVSSRLFL